MNPNLIAFIASLIYGVMVFPWAASLKKLGPAEFFIITGFSLMITGMIQYPLQSQHGRLTASSLGLGVLTAIMYVGALVCVNYAFSHPKTNLPIAAAIIAAYPAWTAVITLFMGQRLSPKESLFMAMIIVGVAGLGLSSKPANQ